MKIKISPVLLWGNVVIFGGVLIVGAVIGGSEFMREREREVFEPAMAAYTKRPTGQPLVRTSLPPGSVSIAGKLIPVDIIENKISPVLNDLPEDLKPKSTDEVKTILWISCYGHPSGTYTDGTTGMANDCTLTFIDFATNSYLWKASITVGPEKYKEHGVAAKPSDPTETIINYIAGIPRSAQSPPW
jgi:hypothetical protein